MLKLESVEHEEKSKNIGGEKYAVNERKGKKKSPSININAGILTVTVMAY